MSDPTTNYLLCYGYAALAPNGGVWVETSQTGALAIYGSEFEAQSANPNWPIVPVAIRVTDKDEIRRARLARDGAA